MKLDSLTQGIIFIQFLSVFFFLKEGNYFFLLGYFVLALPIVIIVLYQHTVSLEFILGFTVLYVLFFILGMLDRSFPPFSSQYVLTYSITSMITAYAMFKLPSIVLLSRTLFFLYVLFLFSLVMELGVSDVDAYNVVLNGASRNYLSALLILLSLGVALAYLKDNRKLPIFEFFCSFIFCLVLYGRSGIMISLMLLFLAIYERNKILFIMLLCVGMVFFFSYADLIGETVIQQTNFNRGLESGRSTINIEYLSSLFDLENLIRGSSFQECCLSIIELDNNPHNSFIMGHARYGILHTLLGVVIFVYILTSRRLVYIGLALVVYLRYALDTMGLFAYYDVYLYLLIFMVYRSRQAYNR